MKKAALREQRLGAIMLGLMVVFAIAAAAYSWRINRQLAGDYAAVTHAYAVAGQVEALMNRVTDGETGERGYLITGQENYLEPYNTFSSTIDHLYSDLAASTDSDLEIPVIFVTAQSDASEEEDGLAAGAVDFIAKSASANVMRARVGTLITLKRQSDLLRRMARVDALTGLANRRYFDETLSSEWRRCTRSGKPLSLVLIDLDHFKLFNDHYGHQAGDSRLQQVSACLRAGFARSHDLVARYGGEEFVCVMPETSLEGAETKARALEKAVRALHIPHEKSAVAGGIVTISLGVAVAMPTVGVDCGTLILCADRSLYMAKDAGRGQMRALQI
jgi:diguanylate cyclase (GGDEF)-like protein